jgi:hypothetical protein
MVIHPKASVSGKPRRDILDQRESAENEKGTCHHVKKRELEVNSHPDDKISKSEHVLHSDSCMPGRHEWDRMKLLRHNMAVHLFAEAPSVKLQ